MIGVTFAAGLVFETDGQPAMEVCLGLEPLGDRLAVELDFGKDLAVWPEEDRRAAAARRAETAELGPDLAARERLLPFAAVPPDRRDHLFRERRDDGCADAMQTARM